MSGLTLKARALLDELTARVNRSDSVRRIWQVAALGECEAIPYLAPLFVAGTPVEIAAVGEAIGSLLSSATTEDLFRLDTSIREYAFWTADDSPWRRFAVSRVPAESNAVANIVLLKLLSMHADGYLREVALRSLNAIHDGSEIPFLLLRLNDWVPQ